MMLPKGKPKKEQTDRLGPTRQTIVTYTTAFTILPKQSQQDGSL